jgi:hypothetical protein
MVGDPKVDVGNDQISPVEVNIGVVGVEGVNLIDAIGYRLIHDRCPLLFRDYGDSAGLHPMSETREFL